MKRLSIVLLASLIALATLPVTALAQEETTTAQGSEMSLADYEQAQDTGGYNSDYLFALSRGLGDSPIHPAGKVPLFIFTVPLDIVLLPFAAIGGFFG